MQHEDNQTVRELIEQYNRQLMDTYRRQPMSKSPPPQQDDAWLDTEFPTPNIEQDIAALNGSETAEETPPSPDTPQFPYTDEDLQGDVPRDEQPPSPPNIGESPFVGYLRVFASTGQTAEPIAGATVTVTKEQNVDDILFATATTDIDGFTPVLPLPSVNPALTMRPDIPTPYVAYDIRVTAPGYQGVLYQNVPVYGNDYVTQSANMLPLIPGQDPNTVRVYRSGAPDNL